MPSTRRRRSNARSSASAAVYSDARRPTPATGTLRTAARRTDGQDHLLLSLSPTNRLRAFEVSTTVGVGVALAVATSWPLVLHLGSDITPNLGDALVQAWQVAWSGHALVHDPLQVWQANAFWPLRDSFALNDASVGYAPAGALAAWGPHSALLVYNLLFLFAEAFAFLGAYLLARELGTGRLGGLCAGAAFAYTPWRLGHIGHLNLISSGGIPFSLFLLLRGYRRGSKRTIAAGWVVAAWQTTLGWGTGLMFTYLPT